MFVRSHIGRALGWASLIPLFTATAWASQLGSAFTFQGQLKQNNAPMTGPVDLRFDLYDDPTAGNLLGSESLSGVEVTNGVFTVVLNEAGQFGASAFVGSARWLQVAINGTPVTPRQALTATPQALYALAAGSIPWSGITGIPASITSSPALWQVESLDAWGDSSYGQTDAPAGNFVAATSGWYFGIAMAADGTLTAWGDNSAGQCNVPSGSFSAVSGGDYFALALRSDGTLAAWGDNSSGQLNVPSGTFIAVAAGGHHGVAIRSNGTLTAWGDSSFGQTTVPSGQFSAVAAGEYFSVGLRTDGSLVAWGDNSNGQTNVPVGNFKTIAAGALHGLAIKTDGTLAGWGYNQYGQTNVPTGTFQAIAGGGYHSLGIRTDGTLAGWGLATYGQTNVPVGAYRALAGGFYSSLAIRQNAPIGSAASADVNGDLTVSGNALVNNNLGIRTSNPSRPVQLVAEGYGFQQVSGNGQIDISTYVDGSGGWIGTAGNAPLNFFTADSGIEATLLTNGNFGIGITNPEQRLSVNGSMQIVTAPNPGTNYLAFGAVGNSLGTAENTDLVAFQRYNFATNGTELRLIIGDDTSTNSDRFTIMAIPGGVPTSRFIFDTNGTASKPGGGSWATLSDVRMKKDITPLTGALDRVLQLKGFEFDYTDDAIKTHMGVPGRQIGLIAQDVEKTFPDWVNTASDGIKSVSERGTTALFVESLRELRAEKDAQIDALRAENAALQARLERLEKALGH